MIDLKEHGGPFGGRSGPRFAEGTGTSTTTNETWQSNVSGSVFHYAINVSGLKFLPSFIYVKNATTKNYTVYDVSMAQPVNTNQTKQIYGSPVSVTATSFKLPYWGYGEAVEWFAIE